MLPIAHAEGSLYRRAALGFYLPTSIERILQGEVKSSEWRSNPLKNKVETEDMGLKQNKLVLKSLQNELKPEVLELKFAATLPVIGNVFVRCMVIYNEEILVTHREFSVIMNIVPINGRNMLYKLFLTSLEIEKILLKRFKDYFELSKKTLLDSLIKVIQMTRVVQNTFTSVLAVPLTNLRKLYRYSSVALLMNTFEKSLNQKKFDSFLTIKPFHHTLNCRALIKLDGKYCVVVVSTMKGFNQADSLYKLVLYWPQTRRTFTFHMYENDWTTAEIGLHKQVMDKSSKFSKAFGIVRKSVYQPKAKPSLSGKYEGASRTGKSSSKLPQFGIGNVSFAAYAEKKDSLIGHTNLQAPGTPFTPFTPNTPYQLEGWKSASRMMPAKDQLHPGSSLDVSKASIKNLLSFGSPDQQRLAHGKSIRSINEILEQGTFRSSQKSQLDSKKASHALLPDLSEQVKVQPKPESTKIIGRVLEGMDYVTPKNVLEEYEKYELKSVELIQEEVKNHRKINLKHTRDCVLTFAGPHTLVSDKRREKYKKFSTAFYWKCMLQMMSILPKRNCARVLISKYDGLLLETIYESEEIIKEELIRIRFTICHDQGYQHKKIVITSRTEVGVEVTNFTSSYSRSDRFSYSDLENSFSSVTSRTPPSLGKLRILCKSAAKSIETNLSCLQLSAAQFTTFLDKNLGCLLPTQKVTLQYYGSTSSSSSRSSSELETPIPETQSVALAPALQHNTKLTPSVLSQLTPVEIVTENSAGGLPGSLVLLSKHLLPSSPALVLHLYLGSEPACFVFLIWQQGGTLLQRKVFSWTRVLQLVPYLEQALQVGAYYSVGRRVYSALKAELLIGLKHGTLF